MISDALPAPATGARTLFQAMGSSTGAYTFPARAGGLLQADGVTLGQGFGVFIATGVISLQWEAGTAGLDNAQTRGGVVLYTLALPGAAANGYTVQNFDPLRLIADYRTAQTDRYVEIGRTSAGVWSSYNTVVRGMAIWQEQLTPLQIYDFHALFQQKLNEV